MPWAWLELSEGHLADDWDNITPIKSNSADVEDTRDSGVRSETDQVDGNAEENTNPNGIKRSSGLRIDLDPDVGEWQEAISGESKDSSAQGLHSSEADEFDDDKSADREENTSGFTKTVEVDLSDGLSKHATQDLFWVAHAEAENDIEKETSQVGEKHSERDGPRGFDLWL